MRRLAALTVLLAVALALAAPASASQLLTWTTPSRYVDPARVKFNHPPGSPARAPALRVDVLLPDGYDGHRRFPVLYLLHGHGDAFDSWMNPQQGDLLRTAPGFPAIVVMPEAATGWYTNWWNGGARANPGWERYHLDELIPLVERRLKIRAGRRWHAIAGLSMGGEGAMYYAEQRPGYFGAAASFSGAISIRRPEYVQGFETQGEHYRDVYGDPQAFYAAGHDPMALTDSLRYTRLFVSVGDGTPGVMPDQATNAFGDVAELDLRQHAQDFVAAAHRSGDDVTYQPRSGNHSWAYWRAMLAAAVRWGFFAPVAERPARWSMQTVSQDGDAWGLRFHFAAPPTGIELLSRDGRRLVASGTGTLRVKPRRGRAFTARLPFARTLPRRAW